MSSTLSEGVRVPDIGSTSWGADVNFNWGLLNTALANISGNVKTNVENTWTAPQTFTETISGSIDGTAARAVGDEGGTNIKTALATKAADNSVVHLAGAETITGDKTFQGYTYIDKQSGLTTATAVSDCSLAFTKQSSLVFFQTRGSSNLKSYNSFLWSGYLNSSTPNRYGRIKLCRSMGVYGDANEYTPDTSFSFIDFAIHYKFVNITDNVQIINDGTENAIKPVTNNATDLGTSGNKWKTLNGINPGALGLQNFNAGITLDTTNWDKTGEYGVNANFWTPTVNGWLTVLITGTPGTGWVQLSQADSLGQFSVCLSTGYSWATIPVVANGSCKICLLCSTVSAKFYPCLGNV